MVKASPRMSLQQTCSLEQGDDESYACYWPECKPSETAAASAMTTIDLNDDYFGAALSPSFCQDTDGDQSLSPFNSTDISISTFLAEIADNLMQEQFTPKPRRRQQSSKKLSPLFKNKVTSVLRSALEAVGLDSKKLEMEHQ